MPTACFPARRLYRIVQIRFGLRFVGCAVYRLARMFELVGDPALSAGRCRVAAFPCSGAHAGRRACLPPPKPNPTRRKTAKSAAGNWRLFRKNHSPDTFEATAEFGMGMAVMRYRIENDRVVPISFVHNNAGVWGTAAVGAASATAFLFWLAKLRTHYTQKTLWPYLLDSAGALLGALQFVAWLAVSFALADGVMRLLPKTAWTAATRDGVYFAALLCSCGLGWLVGRKIKRNIRKRK